ncbi:12632_t:CDS:2 [Gigaspora rosea]|nr:12632_t:CDS:2 [Gigaspora rosea]
MSEKTALGWSFGFVDSLESGVEEDSLGISHFAGGFHLSSSTSFRFQFTKMVSHNNYTTGFFKITLRRSPIGLPRKHRAAVKALGLSKLSQTVYHSHTPIIAGMILKVKELLEVKNVKRVPTPEERKHHTEPGYVVTKRFNKPVQV